MLQAYKECTRPVDNVQLLYFFSFAVQNAITILLQNGKVDFIQISEFLYLDSDT